MATAAEKKKAYEEWKERCRQVQAITDTSLLKSETPVERDMRIKRLLNNYAAFCEYYFPHFLQLRDKTTGEVIRTIHNAPFHNEAARKVRNTPDLKAVLRKVHWADTVVLTRSSNNAIPNDLIVFITLYNLGMYSMPSFLARCAFWFLTFFSLSGFCLVMAPGF